MWANMLQILFLFKVLSTKLMSVYDIFPILEFPVVGSRKCLDRVYINQFLRSDFKF